MDYHIDIDGILGDWAISKKYVKNKLSEHKNKEVNVRMNSLGGSLDHGLDIAEQFATHGNVTCDLFAMNASAATVASLGAKKIRISNSGLYLIHKVMIWVDLFDSVNADDINKTIEELNNKKEELQKMDLIIAKKYADRTGKEIKDILAMMKKGGWMTAQEALQNGFVDEIIDTNVKQDKNRFVENAIKYGLPLNSYSGKEFTFTNNKNQTQKMKKQPKKVCDILNVSALESTEEGVYLNEEQVHAIDNEVSKMEENINEANKSIDDLKNQVADVEKERDTANQTIADKDTEIENLKTQIENLKKSPGAETNGITTETDGKSAEQENTFYNDVVSAKSLYDALP